VKRSNVRAAQNVAAMTLVVLQFSLSSNRIANFNNIRYSLDSFLRIYSICMCVYGVCVCERESDKSGLFLLIPEIYTCSISIAIHSTLLFKDREYIKLYANCIIALLLYGMNIFKPILMKESSQMR